VVVRPVRSRRDLGAFLRLPWRVYENDPQWVPPLLAERKQFVDPRRHPFYLHGTAEKFLALRAGEPVGRVLVSDDPRYNAEHGTNLGAFGLFECLDDHAVAAALLDAAADWLIQRGRTAIWGPLDYSTNYPCGLLVEGFDTPPRVMMNHNPPYYERLLEGWGLERVKDLFSWWFEDEFNMLDRWRARAERLAKRGQIRIRPFRVDRPAADIELCKRVYHAAWQKNWGFVPMTDAEFDYLAKGLLHLAIPEMLLLAEIDGQVVGFSMTLPDLNEAIRPLNGRLFSWGLPLGWWRFHRNRRRIKTARMAALGVLEPYRRRGVLELLILHSLEYGKHVLRYTGAELGWTLEDNETVNQVIAAVGGRLYKRYRLYQRPIG
jgi:GNAT superfamily N-acetyltransferase